MNWIEAIRVKNSEVKKTLNSTFLFALISIALGGCGANDPEKSSPSAYRKSTNPDELSLSLVSARKSNEKSKSTPNPSADTISENAIARMLEEERQKNILARKFNLFADSIDDNNYIGSAYNEIGIETNDCYILGNLLGLGNTVKHLYLPHDADLSTRTSKNANNLRIKAREFEHFGATRLINLSSNERILKWNVDCVGFHGINAPMINQQLINTFFEVDGNVLRILGDIEPGFSNKLIQAINKNPQVTIIALGSRGGSVSEAITAGNFIRSRNLETTLWNGCYSACPLVFLGGIKRSIWSPYPNLGLHQMSINGVAIPINHNAYSIINSYAKKMGADGNFVVLNMWKARPENMNNLTIDESLCQSRVATWVQRVCRNNE